MGRMAGACGALGKTSTRPHRYSPLARREC